MQGGRGAGYEGFGDCGVDARSEREDGGGCREGGGEVWEGGVGREDCGDGGEKAFGRGGWGVRGLGKIGFV